jgi:hypothetical protein
MKTKLTADQKYLRSIPRMSNLQLILLALSRPRPLPAEIFNEIQRRLLKNRAHKLSAYLLWFSLFALSISAWSQDYTYSTNLFYALTYPTNIYVGTNGTDPGGDNFHVWACKINHNTTLLWGQQQSFNWALTNFFATNQPVRGITTNAQLVDGSIIGGVFVPSRTNTFYITNGLIQGFSSP